MTRAEGIEQERTAIAELGRQYGMLLRDPDGADLVAQAASMKLTRRILSPSRIVIPCSASLKGSGLCDPCLVVPASLPVEVLPPHRSVGVGGQVIALSRSKFALSSYLMDESWRAAGHWNGQPLPLLVSIDGEYRYLIRPKSYFFRHGNYRGPDLDQLSPLEPSPRDLKLNRYEMGSDLQEELTVIVAEY